MPSLSWRTKSILILILALRQQRCRTRWRRSLQPQPTLTKHNQHWPIQPRKWQQSAEATPVVEVAAADPGVEVGVVGEPKLSPKQQQQRRGTKAQSTRTFRQESGGGARCTISGGGAVFSVLSPAHARGRTSSPRSQPSEMLASPRNLQ